MTMRYVDMTPEERERKRALSRERSRELRERMTPEERERKRALSRERSRELRDAAARFKELGEQIRSRTKAGLAAARARGVRLGGLPAHERPGGAELIAKMRDVAASIPGASPRTIAARLNDAGVVSVAGKRWHAGTVRRFLKKYSQ